MQFAINFVKIFFDIRWMWNRESKLICAKRPFFPGHVQTAGRLMMLRLTGTHQMFVPIFFREEILSSPMKKK